MTAARALLSAATFTAAVLLLAVGVREDVALAVSRRWSR